MAERLAILRESHGRKAGPVMIVLEVIEVLVEEIERRGAAEGTEEGYCQPHLSLPEYRSQVVREVHWRLANGQYRRFPRLVAGEGFQQWLLRAPLG